MIDPEDIDGGGALEPADGVELEELDAESDPDEFEVDEFEPEDFDDSLDEDFDDSGEESVDGGDYQRLIDTMAEQVAQMQVGAAASDPYDEVAELIRRDPAAAIRRTADIATLRAVQAMLPFVKPVAESSGMQRASEGLDDEGRAFLRDFVREKGIDPALLNDPTVAELVRAKAELHQLRSKPIPYTESVGGYPSGNVDAETRRELDGIEKLYRNLNLKFEPGRLLRRLK
ncbi:MAG TPA: hypothetical protein VHE55_11175 [Fimbriimonadaceae bacterium]|nr:hypothetical protein [Fimbriimonadaceae bacterium]